MRFEEYREHDAVGLASLVNTGEVTPAELLRLAVERAEVADAALGFMTVREVEEAEAALADLPDGPFKGVPYLLKDLFAMQRGRPMTNGSRLFEGYTAPGTSTYVARTLTAGLVPFGKTKSPELGLNVTTESKLHGPTRNPWDLTRSAGGSSGGAAAAVAAGVVPMAHATDGGGSIRIPASSCGLFGLKPSRARNPIGPAVGEAWQGMAGPHCVSRSVRDSAALLDATHGPESGDPYACPPPRRPFLQELDRDPERLKVALIETRPGGGKLHPDCLAAARDAARLLEGLGHTVEPAALPCSDDELRAIAMPIIAANQAADLTSFAGQLGRPLDGTTLERATLAILEMGRRTTGPELAAAIGRMHGLARRMGALFEAYDVVLQPTLATPPPRLGWIDQDGDLDVFVERTYEFIPFTPLYNMTGLPAMSVPLFWNNAGLPIGVMFGARLGDEGTLFALAGQLERARPWFHRTPPK